MEIHVSSPEPSESSKNRWWSTCEAIGNFSLGDTKGWYSQFGILRFLFARSAVDRSIVPRLIGFYGSIYVVGLLLTAAEGSLIIDGPALGYLEDMNNPFYMLALGISSYLVFSLVRRYDATFNMTADGTRGSLLHAIKLGEGYDETLRAELERRKCIWTTSNPTSRSWYNALCLIILLVFVIASVEVPLLTQQVKGNWNFSYQPLWSQSGLVEQYPIGYLFNQVKDAVVYLIVIPPLLWVTMMIAVSILGVVSQIKRKNRLRVRPTSPDKTGGLRPLGELSLVLFYIVIVQLIHVFPTSVILNWPMLHQVIYIPFFIFAAFVFFSPLIVVRNAMREAKWLELNRIMEEFDDIDGRLRNKPFEADRDSNITQNLRDALKLNQQSYDQASSMAVWPYDFRTVVRFATGIVIPLVLYIIQMVVEKAELFRQPDKFFDWLKASLF